MFDAESHVDRHTEPTTFAGEIVLACGHGWPGECDTKAEAEEFLALCTVTGDTARCPVCDSMQLITGPLRRDPIIVKQPDWRPR